MRRNILILVLVLLALPSISAYFDERCRDKNFIADTADVVVYGTISEVIFNTYASGRTKSTDVLFTDLSYEIGEQYEKNQINISFSGGNGTWAEDQPSISPDRINKRYRLYLKKYEQSYLLVCAGWGMDEVPANTYAPPKPDPTSNERTKHVLSLKKGWNLVSVPVAEYQRLVCVRAPCYVGLSTNLKAIDCANVKVFSHDSSGYWDITQSIYQEIFPQSGWMAGSAYWVRTGKACTMTFDGAEQMTPDKLTQGNSWHLQPGWNSLGAPIKNIEFSKLSSTCEISSGPYRFNTDANKWEKAQVLKAGEGYFVKVASECSLSEAIISKKYCKQDDDCTCGGMDKEDQNCFVGNKDYYERNVDKDAVCYDFCTGISGKLRTRCIQNECRIVDMTLDPQKYCEEDTDCVRQESCCDCGLGNYVNKNYYAEIPCTESQCMCATQQSTGVCKNNQCTAVPADTVNTNIHFFEQGEDITFSAIEMKNQITFYARNEGTAPVYFPISCQSLRQGPKALLEKKEGSTWVAVQNTEEKNDPCAGFSRGTILPGTSDIVYVLKKFIPDTYRITLTYTNMVDNIRQHKGVTLDKTAIAIFSYPID
ncbi:MAG: hypothetical protein ABIJ21_09335 [Nanoarchaeota archaeon]